MDNRHNNLHLAWKYAKAFALGHYLLLEAVAVFLELRTWKTVPFSEQIMSAEKYPRLFWRQVKANVLMSFMSSVVTQWNTSYERFNSKGQTVKVLKIMRTRVRVALSLWTSFTMRDISVMCLLFLDYLLITFSCLKYVVYECANNVNKSQQIKTHYIIGDFTMIVNASAIIKFVSDFSYSSNLH